MNNLDIPITWKEVVSQILPEKKVIPKDLSNLVTLCRGKGIGQPFSYQKTFYKKEDLIVLSKIIRWWLLIDETSNVEWRDKNTGRRIQEIIIDKVRNNESLTIFSIFCPSYKTGKGIYGYNTEVGVHTKLLVKKLSRFIQETHRLGIEVNATAYFSDLLLENYEKLNNSDKEDLACNYRSFCEEFLHQSNGLVKTELLSSVDECRTQIGEKGVVFKGKDVTGIYQRVLARDSTFYTENLGWSIEEIERRETLIYGSYLKLAEIFNKKFPNGVIYWVESSYERGLIYSHGSNNCIPVIYPKK